MPLRARSCRPGREVGHLDGGWTIPETLISNPFPALVHREWAERLPWLVQGTTLASQGHSEKGRNGKPWDLALFGKSSGERALGAWVRLMEGLEITRAAHARQVHASAVLLHEPGPPGMHVHPGADGHATRHPDLLLTISLADCIPAFVVEPERRIVLLLHCGWRGVAAGIVEAGLLLLEDRLAVARGDLHVHLGPGVCGECYEVGPEVHEALGEPVSTGPRPIALPEIVRNRFLEGGVSEARVSVSRTCTLCSDLPLFSHRGGDGGRHVAYLAVRRDAAGRYP